MTQPKTTTNLSFPQWFCLKGGRDSFRIDPDRDHHLLFGKREVEDIDMLLKRAIALKEPLRLVWWGQYGIGKTHRLKFTEYRIDQQHFAFYPVHVVCRDIEEKSGFDRLHFDLVNNLGREQMHPLVVSYLKKVEAKAPNVLRLEQLTNSPDIATAFQRFAVPDQKLQLAAWKYLCGEELDSAEVNVAGVTREYLDSSIEFAGVLKVFGEIVRTETGKQLLYLVDQVEALTKIHQRSIEGRWVETMRAVLDANNFGIVMAVGADRLEELPSVMYQPEIVRRFALNNYRVIESFKRDQTFEFMQSLFTEWVDGPARDALAATEGWTPSPTGYDPATFPLTRQAFETVCRYCSDELDRKTAKPSEILDLLNRVAAEAYFTGTRLIDQQFLKGQGITA